MKLAIKIFLFFVFSLTALTAEAATSGWVKSDHIKARIVDERNKFGIEIEVENNWHTYHKNPGDAGIATEFDFSKSTNFTAGDINYPTPLEFNEYGIKTYGYLNKVFFSVVPRFGNDSNIRTKITGAVCNEVCIPYELYISYKPENKIAEGLGFRILLTAFLAGLILNVMPCVLPVLSLKILSIIKSHGKARARARGNFLMTAFGIITSFIILAIITSSLRSYGHSLGWGLHFQSPLFVSFLLAICLFFAASLFGIFELSPPSWLGGGGKTGKGFWGNFMSGVLATTLGTSCTAPVLVTAVSFAFAGSYLDIFLIFILMGFGMAAPFFLFALYPRAANILPKPGPWMVQVKYLLGLMLIGTSVWLATILYSQLADEPMVEMREVIGTEKHEPKWIKFREDDIAGLVGQGKVVFVDVTAKWCVNCQTNKLVVLETDEIRNLFSLPEVITMRGDMTRPNPQLLDYIKKYDRPGIPFNMVYGSGAPEGILLPTLLTKSEVIEAVKKASGGKIIEK